MDRDAAPARTGPPLERDQVPVVGDCREDGVVQRRAVDQPGRAVWESAPDRGGEVLGVLNDEISAQGQHQLPIARGGVRQNGEAILRLRELDRVSAGAPAPPTIATVSPRDTASAFKLSRAVAA